MHAKRANRSVAGEIRELCAIVYTPRDGKEVITGVANVIRVDGETVVENAIGCVALHSENHITHAPAHAPTESIAPTYGERDGEFDEVVNSFQAVEEKELAGSDTERE